jgi:hypothetical protein
MKKITISWMALLCLFINIPNTNAQDSITTYLNVERNFTQLFDSLQDAGFTYKKAPTGTLYNRVFGWSNLAYAKPIETVDKPRLKQAWYDLYTATYANAWDSHNLNYIQLQDYLINFELEHTNPLIAFNYNFNLLNSTAADSLQYNVDTLGFLIDSVGHYVNELGVPTSVGVRPNPYLTKQANLIGLYHACYNGKG